MDSTVAQKLESLIELQKIDSQLDEIKKVRGDLPAEVQDLENEIAGFETRIAKFQSEITSLKEQVSDSKHKIKDSENLIKKYQEQMNNVRNNREYEAISKEIETQELDIQLNEKRIKENNLRMEAKDKEIADVRFKMEERGKDLEVKKAELEVIINESQEEENKLDTLRNKAASFVDERLLFSYNRLRKNSANGLAVVNVKRSACGGCFNVVPPQRQADIRDKKKIIVCEHCGRILANVDDSAPVEPASKAPRVAFTNAVGTLD